MELSKNNRFRTGSVVDIYHTPTHESYTQSINDVSVGDVFRVNASFSENLTIEKLQEGDICAFSFGVGEIVSISYFEGSNVVVEFPKSMFPSGDISVYVGAENQHTLFFKKDRVVAGFNVSIYKEEVSQATYGYAKSVYNLQTNAELILTPIRMVDDGTLNAILYSKGFVLKSCNDEDYVPSESWATEFPIELSGTSIDPIYRRAYLKKRVLTSKSRRAKSTMTFKLIG